MRKCTSRLRAVFECLYPSPGEAKDASRPSQNLRSREPPRCCVLLDEFVHLVHNAVDGNESLIVFGTLC